MLLGETPEDYDKHFILTADIDLDPNLPGRKVFDRAIIAADTNPDDLRPDFQGTAFGGVFDGNGYAISNLYIQGREFLGLFGRLRSGAKISGLGLEVVKIAGTDFVGGLAGENLGIIADCYVTGHIAGNQAVGGLVGRNADRVIRCCSLGIVSGAGEGSASLGGLVGNNNGRVTACYSAGTVTSRGNNGYAIGGLVGANREGRVSICYSTCSVSGDTRVGGLVGDNSFGHVFQSYCAGSVSGNGWDVGGLVGGDVEYEWHECHITGIVTQCFWDIETSGQMTSAGGEGRTTAEMQSVATFTAAGWDFVGPTDGPSEVWAEPEGGGFPIQWWQLAVLPSLPAFSGGTGQMDDPYLISTAEELNSIGYNPRLMESYFSLIADVDLANVDFCAIGNEGLAYAGVFDGNGHKISNLTVDSDATDKNVGLFGYVDGGAINDLGLIDPCHFGKAA